MIIWDLNKIRQIKNINLGAEVLWVEWVTNNKLIFRRDYRVVKTKGVKRAIRYAPSIFSLDLETGNPVQLLSEDDKFKWAFVSDQAVVDFLPGQPDYIMMGAERTAYYDLWKVNISDGSYERIEKASPNTVRWETDKNHTPVVRYDRQIAAEYSIYVKINDASKWKKLKNIRLDWTALFMCSSCRVRPDYMM